MTTHTAPQFRTHSPARATLRGAALLALASTIVLGFLAQVWHGPSAAELRPAAAVVSVGA